MNAVSILSVLRSQPPQPPQPPPPAPPLPNPQPAITSAFQGQLIAAIEERNIGTHDVKQGNAKQQNTKQENTGKDVKRLANRKQDDVPQQPVAMADATMLPLPPPPLATFGLPIAGVEPGSDRSNRSKSKAAPETNAAPIAPELVLVLNVSLNAPLVPPLNAPFNATPAAPLEAAGRTPAPAATDPTPFKPPAAPIEAAKPDSHTELAFALRLLSEPSNHDLQSPANVTAPALPTPVIHAAPDQGTQSTPAIQPDAIARPASARVLPTPLTTLVAAPTIKQIGSAPESGAHSGEGNSPNKETAPAAPKPQQPQPSEIKSQRPSNAVPEPAIHAVSVSPPEASSSATLSNVPAPTASSAPQPSTALPVASPAEPISEPAAAARPTLTAQVTDVSVTVPMPRPDASTDDRVAIRIVQRGAEIHVSVRTTDTQLAQSVRQDLGKLSSGLDQAGFHTETWRPAAATPAAQSNADPQREFSQANPNHDGNAQDSRAGGQGAGGFGEQRRRQQDDRPRWVAELDEPSKP